MASVFDYIFNIGGNFTAQISGMSAAAGNFTAQAEVAESRGRSLASTLASFSYIKDIAQNVADGFAQLSGAGIKLSNTLAMSFLFVIFVAGYTSNCVLLCSASC